MATVISTEGEGVALASSLTRVCRLAEGGMGRVDLAVREVGAFRRMYAVKRLHPHLATDPEFRAMFLDEARIAGRLRHPNVVGVLDFGEDDQGPFLVMDYVDGLPLSNLVRLAAASGELMPVQIAVRIAIDVVRGLHAAHQLSIDGRRVELVHRDLSPQNVLIGFDGVARLTDFGIAKALGRSTRTATGVLKGKLSYMSPEQIRLEQPDRRSDLYSLGVLLFEMLSGVRLRPRDATLADIDFVPPDVGEHRPDVPDELVRLLFELLAEHRGARPADAREVQHRLEEVLAQLLRDEDPADVADYFELVAGEERATQSRLVETAMADLHDARLEPATVQTAGGPSRPPTWLAVGALAVAGAAIGVAVVLAIAGPAEEPAQPPPEAAARPPEPPPIEEAETAPAPEVSAEATVEEEETGEAAPAGPARRRARRARRRRRPSAGTDQAWRDWGEE